MNMARSAVVNFMKQQGFTPEPRDRAAPRAPAAYEGSGAAAFRPGDGGDLHAIRGADPAPRLDGGVLRFPGAHRRGLRRAPLREVLPRRLHLPSPERERRLRQWHLSLE